MIDQIFIDFVDFHKGLIKTKNPVFLALSRNFDVQISEDPDILFDGFGNKHANPQAKVKAIVTSENKLRLSI